MKNSNFIDASSSYRYTFNKIKYVAVMKCRVTLKYISPTHNVYVKISPICLRHRFQFYTSIPSTTISSEFYPNAFSVKNERS